MRLLIAIFLLTTLVACSDDKSSGGSKKPSPPAVEEDTVDTDGPVLEKPSLSRTTPTTSPIVKNQASETPTATSRIKNNLPDDPNRLQSAANSRIQSLQQSVIAEVSDEKVSEIKVRLAEMQKQAQNQPYIVYVEQALALQASSPNTFVNSEIEYCLKKYTVEAPKNTSICYYKLGMGSSEEFALFIELREVLRQQMIASGYIKIIAQEEDYCISKYKETMPLSQTRCYFIMGYGSEEEFVVFSQTAEKLDVERKAAGAKKLEALAREYRESKK
jgi:hypothetical protein